MSAGLPIVSAGLQAGIAMFDATSQANQLRDEGRVDKENARLDLLQGALDSEDIRRRGRAVQGEALNAEADSGGDVSGLSARDLLFQNNLEIAYAAMNARYNAGQNAKADLIKADQARKAARSAIIGGVLRAGAAAVSGAMSASNAQTMRSAYFPGGQRLPMPSVGMPSRSPSFGG